MGFRFRKTIGLGKGLRLNLSKSGVSFSAGRPGATINVGSRGASGTVGLPGTGLSYRAHHGGGRTASGSIYGANQAPSHRVLLGCFGIMIGTIGLLLIFAQVFGAGLVSLGIGTLMVVGYARLVQKGEAAAAKLLEERRSDLTTRLGDAKCARLLAGEIWIGQSEDELKESLGDPVDVDEKVLKTKRREVWKYDQVGAKGM